MQRFPTILAALVAASPASAFTPPVQPPLPGRGELERTSPTVPTFTNRPVANPGALSGPSAPVRIAPGSRLPSDRRPDPKMPGRPATAGPDPLTILNQPEPLVPVDASVEDRNALDTSLRVISPDWSSPTGFRVAYEHPDDPDYSVRLDGALMLVYQDGLYTRRGGRTVIGMPAGAWFVIGREDLRPRIHSVEPGNGQEEGPDLSAKVVPPAFVGAAKNEGFRLDLRVVPARPDPAPAVPVDPPIEPAAGGLRILRDEGYRKRFLERLVDREGPIDAPERVPVTGSPAGS